MENVVDDMDRSAYEHAEVDIGAADVVQIVAHHQLRLEGRFLRAARRERRIVEFYAAGSEGRQCFERRTQWLNDLGLVADCVGWASDKEGRTHGEGGGVAGDVDGLNGDLAAEVQLDPALKDAVVPREGERGCESDRGACLSGNVLELGGQVIDRLSLVIHVLGVDWVPIGVIGDGCRGIGGVRHRSLAIRLREIAMTAPLVGVDGGGKRPADHGRTEGAASAICYWVKWHGRCNLSRWRREANLPCLLTLGIMD